MTIQEFYKAINGNYRETVSRLQSDLLVTKFVKKFAFDSSVSRLKKAQEENNLQNAFLAAHTLKGVAATLGFSTLAGAAAELTEQLRPLKAMPPAALFNAVFSAHREIMQLILQIGA